jgi:hypothetical protein
MSIIKYGKQCPHNKTFHRIAQKAGFPVNFALWYKDEKWRNE